MTPTCIYHDQSQPDDAKFCVVCGYPVLQPCPACNALCLPVAKVDGMPTQCPACSIPLTSDSVTGKASLRSSIGSARNGSEADWGKHGGPGNSRVATATVKSLATSSLEVSRSHEGTVSDKNDGKPFPGSRPSEILGVLRYGARLIIITPNMLMLAGKAPRVINLQTSIRSADCVSTNGSYIAVATDSKLYWFDFVDGNSQRSIDIPAARWVALLDRDLVAVITNSESLLIYSTLTGSQEKRIDEIKQGVISESGELYLLTREGRVEKLNPSLDTTIVTTTSVDVRMTVLDTFLVLDDGRSRMCINLQNTGLRYKLSNTSDYAATVFSNDFDAPTCVTYLDQTGTVTFSSSTIDSTREFYTHSASGQLALPLGLELRLFNSQKKMRYLFFISSTEEKSHLNCLLNFESKQYALLRKPLTSQKSIQIVPTEFGVIVVGIHQGEVMISEYVLK